MTQKQIVVCTVAALYQCTVLSSVRVSRVERSARDASYSPTTGYYKLQPSAHNECSNKCNEFKLGLSTSCVHDN